MNTNKVTILLLALCNMAFAPAIADSGNETRAITKPSADVTLSFIQPGRIQKINYRAGDSVKVGDVLVQLDDSVEQIRLAQLEAESKDKTQILVSEAKLDQSRVDLKRREDKPKAVTPSELEYAKLNLKIAELAMRLARFQNEQAQKKYEEAKLQIERMRLKSPIDGKIEIIEGVEIEAGESVNTLEDVIRVVRIDPLWIDYPVPLAQAVNLKPGHKANVKFPDPINTSVEGTVIYIPAVADEASAASATLKVRIQVPNSTNRPAGEFVTVTFPTSNK